MLFGREQAGVRVPQAYHFIDGVFIMELVRGRDGAPAPRLGDLTFTATEAAGIFDGLLAEVRTDLFDEGMGIAAQIGSAPRSEA